MIKEKVILSLVAIIVSLTVAILGFYFYQGAKSIPEEQIKKISISSPTPTPTPSVYLIVDAPLDESVSDTKIITISGKTNPNAVVTILTDNDEDVITPSSIGDFSTTITLKSDENVIRITAAIPNGEQTFIDRAVTYSTESF